MKIKPLYKLFCGVFLCSALVSRASSSHDEVGNPVSMDNNTYSITCEATTAFMRDEDKLKSDASDAASKFCAAQGKQMKIVSVTSKLPTFSLGYGWAKIVFMALSPGDPILSGAPAGEAAPAMVAAPLPPKSLTTDELYTELLKLDDLRKKGILTDDEFQAEKKKVLSHSN